jgi:hypothetical protein
MPSAIVSDQLTTQMSGAQPGVPPCRFCGRGLVRTVVDLGMSPLCESFLTAAQLDRMEPFYPLHVRVCDGCRLVQLPEYVPPDEIFTEYAYFSSYSNAFVQHAREYVEAVVERLALSGESLAVEIASNDGYLLQHFVEKGVPALGIEPARNVAQAAIERGVPTRVAFFGRETAAALAAEGRTADLVIGNNVLSQVPDINDFVAGMKILLAPRGTITVEFPHLMRLLEGNLFDTIYHEHFSYFSLGTASRIFAAHGLTVFDFEEIWTHGGSLRLYARHAEDQSRPVSETVEEFAERERAFGLETSAPYAAFRARVEEAKWALVEFLIGAKREGKRSGSRRRGRTSS